MSYENTKPILYLSSMLRDLNEDQLQLAKFMSSLSEAGFAAGWMKGLEFDLWAILNAPPKKYGRCTLTPNDLEQLQFLSSKCGCWITFDDTDEEIAIPLEAWKEMVANRR
jgi:hypothetical protein